MALIGLGLMGASLGLAARVAGAAEWIAGYDLDMRVAGRALERGAIDEVCASPAEAARAADVIVFAAPPLALPDLLTACAPALAPDALITDVCSVKAPVMRWAAQRLPDPSRFVGGHPMAGSEHVGVEAATAELYTGCVWVLTPDAACAPETLDRAEALAVSVGARPQVMGAEAHDQAVARISHLPLVAAAALTLTAADDPSWPLASTLAAGGFRDTTRVASGSPRMARDICLGNAVPLLEALDAYLERLSALRERIATGDPDIEAVFSQAREQRERWLATR